MSGDSRGEGRGEGTVTADSSSGGGISHAIFSHAKGDTIHLSLHSSPMTGYEVGVEEGRGGEATREEGRGEEGPGEAGRGEEWLGEAGRGEAGPGDDGGMAMVEAVRCSRDADGGWGIGIGLIFGARRVNASRGLSSDGVPAAPFALPAADVATNHSSRSSLRASRCCHTSRLTLRRAPSFADDAIHAACNAAAASSTSGLMPFLTINLPGERGHEVIGERALVAPPWCEALAALLLLPAPSLRGASPRVCTIR